MSTKSLVIMFVTSACLAQSAAAGQSASAPVIGRFVGMWKEDVSKRKVGALPNLRFERNAKGELEELRGPEVRPVVQAVVFDGKPHPINGGNQIIWKQKVPEPSNVCSWTSHPLGTRADDEADSPWG